MCAQLVMGSPGVAFSFFFAVRGATACACFIEKVAKPRQVVKGESGKLEKAEQGCALKERKESFFSQVPGYARTRGS